MAASFARLLPKVGRNGFHLFPGTYSLVRKEAVFTCKVRWLADEVKEPPIPDWEKPKNESAELTKARLVYQSRKRGMSENGLILSNFANRFLSTFTEDQLHQYDLLINKPNNDWDIFNWATGNKPTPPEYDNEMMKLLKEFVSNPNMESRIRQPDLQEK
ncbi:putative succinate dehydrogenase assembly factor 2, mitochondrial isoform X2 [Apostichopus japonicus]|uniref:Succinate dehydrogenase assembly factor 2, mitochondrial n=1 Tax=Stichopus japonicus TaxID=307972 RepID=A0A2G8L6L8_STIJA|nr:putative succinate dehydrogenase assembly factor 2, mitochondrial isoform X2 [Apostichopus japonicus]